MNIDDEIQQLNDKIDGSFQHFNKKLEVYSGKLNEVIGDGGFNNEINRPVIANISMKIKSINFNYIYIALVVTLFLVYNFLNVTKPQFITEKILNNETHFNENRINVLAHVSYTFLISIGIVSALLLVYCVYLVMKKK